MFMAIWFKGVVARPGSSLILQLANRLQASVGEANANVIAPVRLEERVDPLLAEVAQPEVALQRVHLGVRVRVLHPLAPLLHLGPLRGPNWRLSGGSVLGTNAVHTPT